MGFLRLFTSDSALCAHEEGRPACKTRPTAHPRMRGRGGIFAHRPLPAVYCAPLHTARSAHSMHSIGRSHPFAHMPCLQHDNLTMDPAPYGGERVIEPHASTVNISPTPQKIMSIDFSPPPLSGLRGTVEPSDQVVDLQG